MSDDEIKSFVIFFYLAFLNVDRAKEASEKAIQKIGGGRKNRIQRMISVMDSIFKDYESRITDYTSIERDPRLALPVDIHPKVWLEFLKETPNQEILALIWVHILKFDLQDVCAAIGVSEGTLRYRLGRALRSLGEALA